jgi:hypothetical protein
VSSSRDRPFRRGGVLEQGSRLLLQELHQLQVRKIVEFTLSVRDFLLSLSNPSSLSAILSAALAASGRNTQVSLPSLMQAVLLMQGRGYD